VLSPDGIALRGLFIIDREGVVQHATINNLAFGRSVDETMRVLQAIQYVQVSIKNRRRGFCCLLFFLPLPAFCGSRPVPPPPNAARLTAPSSPLPPPPALYPERHTQANPDEVCPAGWKPGDATMKPDPEGSKEYFAKI
jgi:hypothetical protein